MSEREQQHLSRDRLAALADWLAREEGLAIDRDAVTMTARPLAFYERAWGPPQERRTLPDGAAFAVWRGEGRGLWVADFGEVRAVVAF